jgi:hypothetical protein
MEFLQRLPRTAGDDPEAVVMLFVPDQPIGTSIVGHSACIRCKRAALLEAREVQAVLRGKEGRAPMRRVQGPESRGRYRFALSEQGHGQEREEGAAQARVEHVESGTPGGRIGSSIHSCDLCCHRIALYKRNPKLLPAFAAIEALNAVTAEQADDLDHTHGDVLDARMQLMVAPL